MKECKKCENKIPSTAIIDGKRISLTSRSYCLDCSPFNTRAGYQLRKDDKWIKDKDFIELVKNSTSIRQMLVVMNLRPSGGNYNTIKNRFSLLDVDTSHFSGQGHLKGKTHSWAPKIPLDEILVENSLYKGGSFKLKNRLLKEGVLEHKCYECGLMEWRNKPVPIELEHKNGNRKDNRLPNLTILCPNCHAQTKTYRGKNKGSYDVF